LLDGLPRAASRDHEFLVALGCGPQKKIAPDEDEDHAAGSCGVERWAVKTGTDSTSHLVNLTPRDTTIASLRTLTRTSASTGGGR
jgi:hypothetical protein